MTEKAPSEAVIRVWVQLMRAQSAVLTAIESDLKEGAFPPLGWYDVLLELSRVEDGMRPFELERKILLAQYNLSRLIDRLEEAGYVIRKPAPGDGRGNIVVITDAGRAFQKQMWPTYRAAIARHVGTKLTEREAEQLGDLLAKLLTPQN